MSDQLIQPCANQAEVRFVLNGKSVHCHVESRTSLSDLLRHELGHTGTHVGCEHGVCGACTVLVNDKAVRSCLQLGAQAEGCQVTTIEGLAEADGTLSALQQAFREKHALQCGFCTPGMMMRAYRFLQDNPNPSAEEVRVGMSGNLCRCTGYQNIVKAVLHAAKALQQASVAA